MYCKKCGAEIPDQALVCGKCGTPVKPYDSAGQRAREQEEARRSQEIEKENSQQPERQAYGRQANNSGTTGAGEDTDGRERFASSSLLLGIISIAACISPYFCLPLSIAAILFGYLGLHSSRRRRAIIGIVIGVIMLLTASVLLFCLAALAPYTDELTALFESYMSQFR